MRFSVFALAGLLALSGCSGSDGNEAAPSPSVSPTESSTPTPSPTVSPTPTASPTPSATPSRRIPALDGDVDGDGTRDSVRASATLLSVELSRSGTTVTAPIHADSPRSAAILGYADVDRDGYAEVFVETAEGASTQFVTPYRFDGAVLHELQLEGGPARLGIGGSVTHGDGFRCSGGRLEIRSAESFDGATYTVHLSTYRLTTSELVLVSSRSVSGKQGDQTVEGAYSVDCGSVGDGG